MRDTLGKECALADLLRSSSPDHGYQRTLGVDVPDVLSFYAPDRLIFDKAGLVSDVISLYAPGRGSANAMITNGTTEYAIFLNNSTHELKLCKYCRTAPCKCADDVEDECRQCNEVPCSCLPIFTGLEYQIVLPFGHVIPPASVDFEIQLGRSSLPPSCLSIMTPGNRLLLLSPTATKAIESDDRTCGGDICPWISYRMQVTTNRDSHPELKIHGTDLGSGGTSLGHESWEILFDGRTHLATLAAPVVPILSLQTDGIFATLTWEFYSDSKPTLATLTASIIPHIRLVMTDPRHGQRITFDCSDEMIWTRTITTSAFGKVKSGRRFPVDMKKLFQHSMRLHYTSLRLRGGAPPLSIITIFLVGPDYDRLGSARVVLPRHATLKRLTSVVYDIYFGRHFGRGRTYPIELRRMPSNVILAQGYTLLFSSNILSVPQLPNTQLTDMGVVDKSVVQLYLIPQRGRDSPGPSWPLEEVVAVMSHAAEPTVNTLALARAGESDTCDSEGTDQSTIPPFGPIIIGVGSSGTVVTALERWIAGIAPFGLTEQQTVPFTGNGKSPMS